MILTAERFAYSHAVVRYHPKGLQNIIIISIQPLGRFWQEPEPSQATGMALAH
jgi:hypothetical protein